MRKVALTVSVSEFVWASCRCLWLAIVSAIAGSLAMAPARAEPPVRLPPLPTDCRVTIKPVLGVRTLPAVRKAISNGSLRILAIGSSSTAGTGASVPTARYPARLQARLREAFQGIDIVVVNRGIPGETALGAAARMKREVAKANPDLVLWQLGTNAALNHVDLEVLTRAVRRAVEWVRSQDIGLMFIDPQFVDIYKDHDYYKKTVDALTELARDQRIILIRRYASMVDIAARRSLDGYLAKDRFHLNDLGYRCLANYAAQAVVDASLTTVKTTADGR